MTLCGDRRGRGAKTRGFVAFLRCADEPSAGIGVVEVQKLEDLLRFCGARMNPLRGSAWSRCKKLKVFAISDLPARPSAAIGCRDRRGRGAKAQDAFSFLRHAGEPSACRSALAAAACVFLTPKLIPKT